MDNQTKQNRKNKITTIWMTPIMEKMKKLDQEKKLSFSNRVSNVFDRYYALMNCIDLPVLDPEDEKDLVDLLESRPMDLNLIKNLDDIIRSEVMDEDRKNHLLGIVDGLSYLELMKLLEDKGNPKVKYRRR